MGGAGAAVLALVVAVSARAAAAPTLIAQWRFDESAGQVVQDDGPFALAGGLGASDAPDAADPERIAGASGGALRFAGQQVVQLPDAAQLSPQKLSLEAVVRAPASPGKWRYVLSRGAHECFSGSYGLYTGEAGGIAMYVFDGTHYVVSPTARVSDVWDGGWHHVAGTFDGHQLRLYVDGRPVGQPLDAPFAIDYSTLGDHAAIGGYAGGCGLAFRGDLDLVRVSDGALSPDAVAQSARASMTGDGVTPPSSPLPPLAPLPPAAPGEILISPKAGAPAHPSAPAKAPSCVVRLSRTSIKVRRRTVVRARVSLPAGAHRLTLVARNAHGGKRVATARIGKGNVARLVVKAPRAGRLTVTVSGRPTCRSASLVAVSH